MAKRKPSSSQIKNLREASELPGMELNPASQTVQSQLATRKLLRGSVWFLLACIPVFTLSSLMQFSNSTADDGVNTVTSEDVNSSEGKAAAVVAVNQWLASAPSPLPSGTLVSWDGFEVEHAPKPKNDGAVTEKVTYSQERHRFTLTDGVTIFDSQVLVLTDGARGVKTVGTPTLLPRPAEATSNWRGEVPWFGYSNGQISEEMTTAINGWAHDLASGSPRKLKDRVGDPDANRSYVPLTGIAAIQEVRVDAVGYVTPPPEEKQKAPKPKQMLARVSVMVAWEGQPDPEVGSQFTPITYDVLVDDADTSAPRVVSWGGAGSGPELRKFSVGLNGVKLKEPRESLSLESGQPETEPAAAPASTPTPAPAPAPEPVTVGGH